jgi:hypothetical protein
MSYNMSCPTLASPKDLPKKRSETTWDVVRFVLASSRNCFDEVAGQSVEVFRC